MIQRKPSEVSDFQDSTFGSNDDLGVSTVVEDDLSMVQQPDVSVSEAFQNAGVVEQEPSDESFVLGGDDLKSNLELKSESSDVPEADEEDFGDTMLYVQDGVYVDVDNGVVNVCDEVFDGIVEQDGSYMYHTGQTNKEGKEIVKKMKVKKYRRKKKKAFKIGILSDENFGALLPFIQDINITDINWNGKQLWLDDVNKGRYLSDVVLSQDFIDTFSIRVSNVVSKTFNKYCPSLEAETEDLRITVMHESISHTGRAISIRKTPAVKRINFAQSIKEGKYCSEETANFMSNAVKAKMNIIICGLPGVGKTELVKYLTNYIFARDRVITIEDTLELHYSAINEGKDCLEFKISPQFSYTDAIKESLRLLSQWVLLSEARSTEVRYLIESVSTGTKCMTTLHSDDVRKIPDRIVNMIGDINQSEIIENSVYNFFDVGILIDKKIDDVTGAITRWISQVCLFTRVNNKNECIMILDDSKLTNSPLPKEFQKRFEMAGITNPFAYTFI